MVPVSRELPASAWRFDPSRWPEGDDCVAVGADTASGTILGAYAAGAFPMPGGDLTPMLWWSPVRRGVLELADLQVSRSLRRARAGFEIRVDSAFAEVIAACADPAREGAWINREIMSCYCELHRLGWAHSVEAWTHDGQLAGGLYGIAIGGLFAGESMFHHRRDASKVALCGLVDLLRDEHADERLIDVQWQTPHLTTLGVREIDRDVYLERLAALLDVPLPAVWS
ncbi:MAG: leucyl/phenylalanyl-tRNA--protein transferase [Actinomycetota bacterium]|nr:leucyl/phenylalanyl-tRNA--protein transferase [Actinomycetota bacterium]